MKHRLTVLFVALTCMAASAQTKWHDAADLTVIGKPIPTAKPFARIDTAVYKFNDKIIDRYANYSTGLAVLFETDSRSIKAKWTTGSANSGANMAAIGQKGLDLYIMRDGKWVFAGTGSPKMGMAPFNQHEGTIVADMAEAAKQKAAAFYGNEIHTTLKAAGSVFRYNITTGESGTYTASSNPMDICVLSSGVRYVAARDGKCIDVYQKDSDTKTSISLGFKPISLSVDSDEEYLYLGAYEARKLYRMKLSDNTVTQIAGTGTAPDKPVNINASSYPTWNPGKPLEVTVGDVSGVYCDSDDYVYFNDNHSTRVQVLIPGVGNDPTKGLIRTFNATASPGTFGTQGSITKDSNGNFYVASKNRHKIVKMIPKN